MSVIVYDVRNGLMCSDTRAYGGDSHPIGNKRKIHRLSDGSLLGMSSSQPGVPEEFKAWIERGAKLEDYGPTSPDIEALLVKPNGDVFLFSDSYYAAGPLTGDVFTVGSGKKYALGALRAGADAQRAVEVACECDTMCGGPVTALKLFEATPEPPVPVSGAVSVVDEAIDWLAAPETLN
jgi:hypothetical protein